MDEAMPGSKTNQKPTGKSTRQLLFSKALHHKRPISTITGPHSPPSPTQSTTMSDKEQSITMEKILQEITAVSRRIEGMDASLSSLTLETKSMRLDIAGFQTRVTGLEHHMGSLETQMTTYRDRDQDLLYLRSKLTDLEDRSRRDNIRLLGIPEHEEGTDMQAFLGSVLPKITSLDFDPPLEFQRAHRVGPKRSDTSLRPRPIIACLLRHNHARQILQTARKQGPSRIGQHDIRITADYSKDTNERRKAFLALRPRLRQMGMKFGLFDPARMWVTNNSISKDFYNPDELSLFLDSFQHQPMDSTNPYCSKDTGRENEGGGLLPPGPEKEGPLHHDTDLNQRGRDTERLARLHDDRGQVLHAVATYTQLSERDKSRSPLKPMTVPP
ncbi:hypothetical protein NDU88_003435 [Pleurodeles waltl]|uniref:L1 transposable element RRM domain-containing protein n=1 Tax=Pleurodeles waltl TaxID=8319 RepID=A0AAV7UF58_PLEWA|nr:hypothetical protein NDU88_003435 [Pleurodeles waltl]